MFKFTHITITSHIHTDGVTVSDGKNFRDQKVSMFIALDSWKTVEKFCDEFFTTIADGWAEDVTCNYCTADDIENICRKLGVTL